MGEETNKAIESYSLKLNPLYGTGRLRRRVMLRQKTDNSRSAAEGRQVVLAELEDNHHAFRVRLFHDGQRVCFVNGDALRFPNDTCPGSLDLLNRLVGVELGKGPKAFSGATEARAFCTHLFDLACLAYTQASRDEATREYHAIVEDERDGIVKASVTINNTLAVQWNLKNNIAQNDGKYKGVSPHTGFMRWAMQHLQGDEQEAAIVLAKAVFVAFSRRVDTEHVAGTGLVKGIMPKDICYTYRSPVMERATHLANTVIDYSNNPQNMLKFVEI
jgi:hypothetical protein